MLAVKQAFHVNSMDPSCLVSGVRLRGWCYIVDVGVFSTDMMATEYDLNTGEQHISAKRTDLYSVPESMEL